LQAQFGLGMDCPSQFDKIGQEGLGIVVPGGVIQAHKQELTPRGGDEQAKFTLPDGPSHIAWCRHGV
jgi:hypothetical protein